MAEAAEAPAAAPEDTLYHDIVASIQKTYDEEESPRGNNTASVIFFIIRNYGIVALVFMFILPIFFCVVLYYAAAVPFVRLLRETRAALRQARATLAAREPPL